MMGYINEGPQDCSKKFKQPNGKRKSNFLLYILVPASKLVLKASIIAVLTKTSFVHIMSSSLESGFVGFYRCAFKQI